ncbi:Ig-like domain-containing protein [Taibaiella koreensis]|uniref:Ig-like domain-containing protein n=1 Tax=Taibaiella koreensis TaxID=1268548 RepID=UPI000E59F670|nr:T9SS type A sorting domain-containing protein [Taibaiella koreensis]
MKTTLTRWLLPGWRQKTRVLAALLLTLAAGTTVHAQAPANDNCPGAIALTAPGTTCTNTAGTTVGATLSMAAAPCSGTPDDDVWFSFVATATDVKIDISGVTAVSGGSTDMYFQVLSGACGTSQTSLLCSDPNSGIVGGLTIGQTYYIRAYTYLAGVTATFDICVTNLAAAPASCGTLALPANNTQTSIWPTLSWNSVTNASAYDVYLGTTNPPTTIAATVNTATSYTVSTPLVAGTDYYWYVVAKNSAGTATGCGTSPRKLTTVAPPANNECATATVLTQGATCVTTAGTTAGASQSLAAAPCSGNPDDDVWFSFVATATDAKIELKNITAVTGTSIDMYFQVLSGACGSTQTSLLCSDPETGIVGGLTVGQTYYIRVYTFQLGNSASFDICVSGLTAAPAACGTLSGPANNSLTLLTPTLSWSSAANASAYDVYFGTVNPPTTVVATVINGTSYTLPSPLTAGTDYYWYVAAKNSVGAATGCSANTRKFTPIGPATNNECANAITLVQSTTCTPTAGSTVGATQSMAAAPCSGNPDDDVWFSFVATATDAKIDLSDVVSVTGSSVDMFFQVLSGACGTPQTSLLCSDPNSAIVGGLTVGQIYYIRVYTYGAGNEDVFNICVSNLTAAPTACATLSSPANNSQTGATPTLSWSSVTNATAYDVYLGTANPPTTLIATVSGNGTTAYTATTPLAPGDYYWYIVPKNSAGAPTTCATNTRKLTVVLPPANDNCGGAVTLTVNPNYACGVTTNGTTIAATPSSETAPTVNPAGTDDDVWYTFTATNSNHRVTLSNVTGISTDMAMAIYSGSCGALAHIQSSDPNTMDVSGLTPGQSYKVRVYTYSATAGTTASFTICVGTPPPPPPNDNCSGAITLTVNPDYNCATSTAGTTVGATASTETAPTVGASGTDDDVWYTFTATAGTHIITLSNVAGDVTDMAMAIYSGSCGALVHVQSSDPDEMVVTGLTPGQNYKIRVYTYTSTFANWASFNICVTTVPPPPANDECNNAVTLTVNPDYNCGVTTAGTTAGATQSTETAPTIGASGVNDDVWYTFTATNASHTISLSNVNGNVTDMAMAVYSGSCGALVHVQSSDPDLMTLTGLTPGQSYKVRVYTYTSTANRWASFNICVGTLPPPPPNDNCGSAIALTVNPDYNCGVKTSGSTAAATQSTETAPTVGASGVNDDVWYAFTATSATHVISLSEVYGSVTDMAMAVYSGSCGALVHVQSSDPNEMTVTGLTPGQNYKVRVYTYTSNASDWASFKICVGTKPPPPPNDDCANAQSIAQLTTCNNTPGTTASATLSMAAGACSGTPDDDVWYSFIATGPDARVTLSGIVPLIGGSSDMYFQVLSGSCGTTSSLLCSDPNTGTVTGLTAGQVYYVRVYTYGSGNAAAFNICVTNISAPTICPVPTAITVPAASVTANAASMTWTPPGLGIPTGYEWEVRSSGAAGSGPSGLGASGTASGTTAATGTVLAGSTTYSVYVRTNCGLSNNSPWSAATTFTTLCSNPPVVMSVKDSSLCGAGMVTLEAQAPAGATLRWYTAAAGGSPLATGSPFATPSISTNTTFYVSAAIGAGNLCEGPRVPVTATIKTRPVATITPAGPVQICNGSTTTLTAGGGSGYQWRNALGNLSGETNATLTTGIAGNYQVVAIAANNCTDTSVAVTVNAVAAPVVNLGNDTAFCAGNILTLQAGNPGASYLWDNSSTGSARQVSATGVYFVEARIGDCLDKDTISITVHPLPVVALGNDTTICSNAPLVLDAGNPGATYLWNGGSTVRTLSVHTAGNYSVVVTDAHTCTGTDAIQVNVTGTPSGTINAVYSHNATYIFNAPGAQHVTGYTWNFGDGSAPATGAVVEHQYTRNGIFTVSVTLGGACENIVAPLRTVDVFDAQGTGIPTVINDQDLVLYPNPARDLVTIENKHNLKMKQITVCNTLGQVLFHTAADSDNRHQLHTSALASGVYLLRIDTDKGMVLRKFEILK